MTRPARTRPTRARRPRVTTLPQLMATAVEAAPDGAAITFADAGGALEQLTYAELDERSTRLARLLIDRGIGPEDLVAVGIPRSIESVVAVWAVAKTGAGFVPIDPNYPADRVDHMVADSGAVFGLAVAEVRDELPGRVEWLLIDTAEAAARLEHYPADPVTYADRVRPLRAEHPAYVIYTSGSTGLPKGVVVTQAGLASFCAEQRERYQVTSGSRTLHFASPSFDASVLELLLAIGGAATMVVVAPTVFGGDELAALLRRERVTHAFVTPAALASVDPAGLDDLRVVVAGGEACPPELVRRWVLPLAGGGTREFYNGYGPTETTIMTNISAPLAPEQPVTIGAPIRAVTEYVLDERLFPVADGVTGELYITGAQVARGYHARPGLTAARFIANPFDPNGGRLYRTGDLVRVTPDGDLEYLGRNDFQVKIRGFRIELGEIDAVLAAHPSVDFAVTVGHQLDSGTTILASYVHPAPGQTVDAGELAETAEHSLPAHMVPTSITVLDQIPLTPVGKLDRAALPAPHLQSKAFRAPATPLEQAVADIYADLLGPAEVVGADDDFFELGGNSLIATQVAARLGAAISARVPARLIFEAPTVARLAARLETFAGAGGRRELGPMPRPERVPLSPAQQRMWFLNQFDPSSAANNIPFAVRLSGVLDVASLGAAVADVIGRHESLRTVYPAVDGAGYQVVLPVEQVAPDLVAEPVTDDELPGWLTSLVLAGFDVAAAVPLRIALAELAPDEHVVAVVVHHIAADGASVGPFLRDLLAAFLARRNNSRPFWAPLPVQYADYTLWQREVLGDENDPDSLAAEQIAFWRDTLAGIPDRIELPTDQPRPAAATGRGAVHSFELDEHVHRRIAELAHTAGVSEFMVMHAAFAVLLARLSASDDITIGTPVAGRGERELDDLIGMFVNTLVLRTRVDLGSSFLDVLAAVKDTDLAAFAHAELPFERLVEVLDPVRSQAHHPLFQVALFFQNLTAPTLELPGLTASTIELDGAIATFDLQLTVVPRTTEDGAPAGMSALFTYATDLFEEPTVAEFGRRLARVLTAVTADPRRCVGDIELLSRDDRNRMLLAWNDTGFPLAPELLLDGYRRTVTQRPDTVAVVYEDTQLTYREFDARVNRLARLLVERGVGPESLVGLAVRRSLDLVVGMYAIVTAGGAYVPLDPDHPAERIAHILDTAEPVCVLTTAADAAALPDGTPALPIDTLDLTGYATDPVRPDELLRPVLPQHPAYVIFTSGSTGRPKGVAVSHAAINNQIAWMLSEYPLGFHDVYLQKTATTFDVSLWGYFLPLRVGATLVVATPDGHRDPVYVAETIAANQVTVTDFVPSMLTVFAAHTAPGSVPTLREIFVIGEALPPETVTAVRAISTAKVHNLYGPTEAAVSVTFWPAAGSAERTVPIGLPQWNTRVYVLDSRLRPVPAGVPGELYLAGDQLARGYVRRPDLTADRFVANPFGTGERMYRTGDLVLWRDATGQTPQRLDYLGRTDFQVKFRGQRIELGEIETALLAHPSVSQAVAIVTASSLGDQLVAYAVPVPGHSIDQESLLAAIGETLPAYMVPATIVALDALPLNPSGKLDRKALPEPTFATRAFRVPATPVEEIVAGVFGEVLGLNRVGADDDFFALGGNSLVATQVVARLGAALDTRVPVRALFDSPTVNTLAKTIESAAYGERIAVGSIPRPDRLPLSLAQQRMWFLNRFAHDEGADSAGSAAYNLPFALRLTGELDVAALEAAFDDVVARHEVLRTVYPETPDGPVQVVLPAGQMGVNLTAERVDTADVPDRVYALASASFDVTTEVPVRVRLFDIADEPDTYVLVVVVHHIAGDASSMGPLVRDVVVAYGARLVGAEPGWAPLGAQYADFALWQRVVLGDEADSGSVAGRQVRFWRERLAGLPDVLELPADRVRPAVASMAGGRVEVSVGADTHTGLMELARAHNATLFMVVHAAFAVLLARLSGTDDIAIGTPVAGRGERELDDLIGMFVNTVVFRSQIDGHETFADLLMRQREIDLEAFANADVPFERLVEVLNPPRSTAHHPLFQVGLSFQNMAPVQVELPGLVVSGIDADVGVSQFDLHLIVADSYAESGVAAGIGGFFTYATDLFDADTVRGFADRFTRILDAVATDATVAVGDIDILDPAERSAVLSTWNDTHRPLALPGATLSTLLDRAIAAGLDAPALVADLPDGDRVEIGYAELDRRVNRLARRMISLGVTAETPVALAIRRSPELVIAMYAVTRAGGSYVPLDPDQPAERIGLILDTARPVCVLTDNATGFGTDRAPVVHIDDDQAGQFSGEPVTDADRGTPIRPEHTAYIIFTSGSTGRPKGVAVSHAAIVNQLLWKTATFELGLDDIVLLKTAATFDLSVWEFWSAICCGGRLVIAAPDGHRDPAYLNELIAREAVTTLHTVPSLLDALLTADTVERPRSLRRVLAIGETLPAALAQRFCAAYAAYPLVALYNLYGPTEAAVSVTSHQVTDADRVAVPIGAPEWNTRAYVLDARLRPVPPGVPGELYLAGAQLARGYYARPDLTADRFVADPYGSGERMYRTGDLAVWTTSGELDYRGRTDFQVKIRGFRIELGDIEAALLALPQIGQAVVLATSDPHTGDRLVAYLVPAADSRWAARTADTGEHSVDTAIDTSAVQSALDAVLPSYMVPSAFVVLDALPLTPNGKLDRTALPAPEFQAREFRAPTTPVEEIVARVYAELLGVEQVGADDDFFDLGGNSLLATQAVARIGAALERRVAVRALFEAPTVAGLAVRLEHTAHTGDTARVPLVAGPRPERIPLSFAQQRMWFLNQYDTSAAVYNIPVAIRLSGELDVDALGLAVGDLIARHEILRTIYPQTADGPVQQVLAPHEVQIDLAPVQIGEERIAHEVAGIVAAGFDVTVEVPFRATLFQLAGSEYGLVFVAHHISADGWSLGPLTRDLMLAYTARTGGQSPTWAPLPVQYADYALWQRAVLGDEDDPASIAGAQLAYWTTQLADLPDELNLPSDRPRPPAQSFAGGTTEFIVDAAVHAGLTELARVHNATVFMVMHTALAVFLSRMSGTEDIAIGTPIAGRGEAELDDLIGMFVNTLVLRSQVRPDLSFAELLAANRETGLRAFANADIPFERLVEALDPQRSAGRHPLFQVALSFENLAPTSFELPGLSFTAMDPAAGTAKFDLLLTVREMRHADGAAAGITAEFTYARDLFDEETVVEFGHRFQRILAAAVRDAGQSVGDLDILDESEYAHLTTHAGGPAEPVRTLPELMADAVAANPDGIALTDGARSFTYTDVDSASAQLARVLIDHGAGPDVLVAVALRRSVESVLTLWAVAKTGAAPVPLDPAYPADRIAHMVADSGAALGVTMSAELAELPAVAGGWIALDDPAFAADVAARPDGPITDEQRRGRIHPANAAYVIYTSGSTGMPKGVVVTHRGLHNFSSEQIHRYRLDRTIRALAFASPSFDASMLELLLAVGPAGTLVVAPPLTFGGDELAELIQAEGVTHAFLTPSVLASLHPNALSGVRVIIAGGEAVSDELADRWSADPNRALYNGYGPTETTIMTNISDRLEPGAAVTIGGPIRGMRALVLDTRLRPVPEGVVGELYLGGIQLARGYHARPGLTAARFVADPYGRPGDRLYRTGDVVRWLGDEVEYVGRNDFQVKVRGFRIELGEIDSALASRPDIDFAVTVGRESGAGATMLVSYVLPAPDANPDTADLTADLAQVLPDHMVPAAIIVLDQIPLTPVGKLDRRALPEPVLETRAYRAPRTRAEEVVAAVIGEVLGIEQVGVDDDFFALGGDSIVSIQVVSRARAQGVEFAPRDVFEARTVAALAARASVAGSAGDESGELPATPTAVRLLGNSVPGVEVRAIVLGVPRECPAEDVETAVCAVLQQHPMLWVRLDPDPTEPVLRIPPAGQRHDQQFRWLDPDSGETTLPIDDVVQAAAAALDPVEGRNIHFVATGTPEQFLLVVVANALVVDDISWRTIIDQLTTAWNHGRHAAPAAPESGLGAIIRSLAEYARSPQLAEEALWWERALTAVPQAPAIGAADLRARRRVSLTITAEGTEAVATVAEAYHATVTEVLLTAVALALRTGHRETVTTAIGSVIRLEADGRAIASAGADNIVGGFRTEFPLPLALDGIDVADALVGGPAAGAALVQIKELHRSVPRNGIGYALLRYLNPDTGAGLRNDGRFALRYRDLRPARVHTDTPATDLLLALTVDATDEGLLARFDYAAEIFAGEEVKIFAEHWIRALGGLAEHGLRPGAGGFTPSDFPLVRLQQADIDRFAHTYPGLSDIWPVTPLQSGMLFHALLADTSVDVYTTQFMLDLGGAVDPERMRLAAQAVLDRHDNLRVAFADDAAGKPVQIVQDGIEVPWRLVDLTHLPVDAAAEELRRLQEADLADHFDMRSAPLLRFALVRTTDTANTGTYRLLVTSHHILIDGWSMPLLMQDLLTLYVMGGNAWQLPAAGSYRDYLAWLVAQDGATARQAWRQALSGITEPTPLAPVELGRQISAGVGEVGFALSPEDTAALSRLAAHLGVTVNTVVQAAWGLLIGCTTDRDDVVFGATVSGRPPQLDGVETMVGLFLNAIPVRVRLAATDTLGGLLRQLQAEQAALLDYHYVGLSDIQDEIGVEGLFDSLVVFESFPVDREGLAARADAIDGMSITGIDAVNGTHYPLTVMVVLDHQLRVSVKYLRDVFDVPQAETLMRRLETLIGRFVAEPQTRLADIDVLLDGERAELAAHNATEDGELLDEATLLSLFDAQVARTPQAPAVRYGDTVLTYLELDRRARALAAELTRYGVGRQTLVAVAMRRGIDLVVAVYAVLRAGGAYVPVDPDHPAERNEYVLAGAAPLCVLTTSTDGFATATGVPVVAVDTLYLPPVDADAEATLYLPRVDLEAEVMTMQTQYLPRLDMQPDNAVRPDDLAYVIYTSGSTGRPKGVAITHRQMTNQFRWAQRTYPHDVSDVVLHKTPTTFDISTWELFWPLQTGASILIAEPDGHRDPAYLSRVITDYGVTTVHFVPSMLDVFLDPVATRTDTAEYPSLRRVFAAGEALPGETAARFAAALPTADLINWYGPAEATVVTAHPVTAPAVGTVPIGTPVANTRVHVLDRQLRPVPPGAPGELYVAGVQLARGYYGAPALTAERFIAHDGGARLYRTGDMVRWRDGALEYLGRSDFQVKLRGQRIELGEIEAVLLEHPSVRHTAVSLVRDGAGERLAAYVVPAADNTDGRFDDRELLAHLRASLPSYMVPSALVVLDELPLNASGKLDRKALPAPQLSARPYRAPGTPLEQTVTEVFAEVLGGRDKVGLDTDFFDLGGNSLLATRAVSLLRARTGAQVRVQWFFTDSTPAEITARILAALAGEHDYDLDSNAALGVLLPIRTRVPHDTEPAEPLFCIHPMYGLSWCYAGFPKYLPASYPVYGLQSPALSEDGYLPESLTEMAQRYVAEIRAVQPEGPYHLLGWSLGGVIAHAVATELQAAGQQVALLAMLDSHPAIDVSDFRAAIREALAELGIGADAVLPDGDIHDLTEEGLAALHATIPPDMAVLTPERVRRIYRSAVRSAELIAEHRPGVFRGRLDYFSAADNDNAAANWAEYVDGTITDHPIPAVHDQMTSPEAVAQIGPLLAELFDLDATAGRS
ncbi:non-ribosomal peptide synthetase [Nocardia donostiensis]|uniref:Non-ribosomal peptide synthetase n=1 Tax=Nocardia donostiensis TaxID=1538463 RepID=A0A1V2TLP8_9NOCA|nr:non-ribosomal peptide synthetase [Nocardia donostiensis]ONM50457.1 non-ribosomal peptide synthetase [Nocardia donostiensis]OQS18887.1 non-ribosomal peptide synthetase [Nocardia donostiensis]